MACIDLLGLNIGYDMPCDAFFTQGIERSGYIFNREEVSSITYGTGDEKTGIPPNMVTQFVLNTGAHGYRVLVPPRTPFAGTKTEMVEGTYQNSFTHTLQLVILDAGATTSYGIIDRIANGTFMVVLENKFKGWRGKGVDNAFQIYGAENGLVATGIEREPWSDETRGGWMVTLTEENSSRSGTFLRYALSTNTPSVEEMREYLESFI